MNRVGRIALSAGVALALVSGCAATPSPTPTPSPATEEAPPAEPTTVRIASLRGPTTMGLVGLMADAEAGEATHDYQVSMYGTADEVVPLLVQGEVDAALIPANLAAVLHNRTLTDDGAQIQVAAINTLGVLEIVETGDEISSIADLAGHTIYSTGKGTTPEFVLNHLLTANGLDPATDVTIEYRSEATEVAALLESRPDAVGVLPQPYVTVLKTQNPDVRTALSFTDEWAAVNPDSALVTGVVVVRTEFAQENPGVLADFLADYRASTDFTNTEPAAAAELITEAGIVPAAPVAEAAIPSCNITYIDGEQMRTMLSGYLQVLFDADPAAVGGTMPGDDFYLG